MMKRTMVIFSTLMACTVAHAQEESQQYYVKVNGQFKAVTKTDATLSLLQKAGPVYRCQEQVLNDKVQMHAVKAPKRPKAD